MLLGRWRRLVATESLAYSMCRLSLAMADLQQSSAGVGQGFSRWHFWHHYTAAAGVVARVS
jgi:hypothetical protein